MNEKQLNEKLMVIAGAVKALSVDYDNGAWCRCCSRHQDLGHAAGCPISKMEKVLNAEP